MHGKNKSKICIEHCSLVTLHCLTLLFGYNWNDGYWGGFWYSGHRMYVCTFLPAIVCWAIITYMAIATKKRKEKPTNLALCFSKTEPEKLSHPPGETLTLYNWCQPQIQCFFNETENRKLFLSKCWIPRHHHTIWLKLSSKSSTVSSLSSTALIFWNMEHCKNHFIKWSLCIKKCLTALKNELQGCAVIRKSLRTAAGLPFPL